MILLALAAALEYAPLADDVQTTYSDAPQSDQERVFADEYVPLPEIELSAHRGGFKLPNGVDVALTVQSQTAIDGAIVLRTVFRLDQGSPQFSVFAPKPGEPVAAPTSGATSTSTSNASEAPIISFDSRSGVHITQSRNAPSISVTFAPPEAGENSAFAELSANGHDIATDNGTISQSSQQGLASAQLQASDISIRHLAGHAFGSVITNAGSDRIIDTQTSINIDLRNAEATLLGSGALRIDSLIIDGLLTRK